MSKVYSEPGGSCKEQIDKNSVADFFEKRAEKINTIGPLHAVIYQEKNPEIAYKRDIAEKEKLKPLLNLDGTQRVLDVGCGTGRWANSLVPFSTHYHGIDACAGLIAYARKQFKSEKNCLFTVASATAFSLSYLGEKYTFDRILCSGVLIYLNDDEVKEALMCIFKTLAPGGLILIREPMGLVKRLTISKHYSEELEQEYSAIYRTMSELMLIIKNIMPESFVCVRAYGDVYDNPELNNRSDTRQQWLLLERSV